MLAAAGGFVENGAVNFGSEEFGFGIGRGRDGGAQRQREEFGLGEEAKVDDWDRFEVKEVRMVVEIGRAHV